MRVKIRGSICLDSNARLDWSYSKMLLRLMSEGGSLNPSLEIRVARQRSNLTKTRVFYARNYVAEFRSRQ